MHTIQVNVLNPKAYKLLQDLAELELISLEEKDETNFLKKNLKTENLSLAQKKILFKEAFGAFESEKSAEEIIEEIKSSRIDSRNMEQF